MGTGLGPESYAIIEQGRIGQILSSKPQDRRSVIEEAAGITKFKTRKRLAEAKLEGAKQNLARVYDILEEVNRQVNSLKRQASKAKRYTELKVELETRLRVVSRRPVPPAGTRRRQDRHRPEPRRRRAARPAPKRSPNRNRPTRRSNWPATSWKSSSPPPASSSRIPTWRPSASAASSPRR